MIFQSTRPIRGATKTDDDIRPRISISIHAPHTGRDPAEATDVADRLKISIHAPHTGRDLHPSGQCNNQLRQFQSTRPIRGATALVSALLRNKFISIHAPHTGRDDLFFAMVLSSYIFQSTRPIRGATGLRRTTSTAWAIFQSTRPIRGATFPWYFQYPGVHISIHAPHTGRDDASAVAFATIC